ncbi:MAG: type II secretion system protein GspG [Verrucomicrobiota bacterium]
MKMPTRRGSAAFTLIEVITVITIILILAGLVVSGAGFVKDRQANEKARVQIALISKALEEYKLDAGSYPPTDDSTDDSANGIGQSNILFQRLYFDALSDTTKKLYLAELDPAVGKQKWTSGTASITTKIVDPWGGEYRYRTAIKLDGKAHKSTQNPDFDLWSSGKDKLTKPATPSDTTNRDDIKNF